MGDYYNMYTDATQFEYDDELDLCRNDFTDEYHSLDKIYDIVYTIDNTGDIIYNTIDTTDYSNDDKPYNDLNNRYIHNIIDILETIHENNNEFNYNN